MYVNYMRYPQHYMYNIGIKYEISSATFDIHKFKQSLYSVVQRHPLLHSYYIQLNGICYYKPMKSMKHTVCDKIITMIDSSEYDVESLIKRPFQLESQLPIRVHIKHNTMDPSNTAIELCLVIHHLAVDGYSLQHIIHPQLWQTYNGVDVVGAVHSYNDYVQHVNSHTLDTQYNVNEQFWLDHIPQTHHPVRLPAETMTVVDTNTVAPSLQLCAVDISETQWNIIQQLQSSRICTTYTYLTSCIWLLLSRYTNQTQFSINMAFFGRPSTYSNVCGVFANAMPVTIQDINLQSTVQQLLDTMQSTIQQCKQHDTVSMSDLRGKRTTPKTITISTVPPVTPVTINNTVNSMSCHVIPMGDVDLQLYIFPDRKQLLFVYNEYVYTPEFIQRFSSNLLSTITNTCMDINQQLHTVQYVCDAERNLVLSAYQQVTKQRYDQQCLHELFDRQVLLTPNAIAVMQQARSITYNELHMKSNQLACYMQQLGAQPNTFIALLSDRNIEGMICMLAILKCGAAYVPIDVTLPSERIRFILDDSNANIVLCTPNISEELKHSTNNTAPIPQIIDITMHHECFTIDLLSVGYQSVYDCNAICCMIYTSGTTGKPKAVELLHRSACNTIGVTQQFYTLTSTDRLLQAASWSFDAHIWQVFSCYHSGAVCCLRDKDIIGSIKRYQCTVIDLVPSVLVLIDPLQVPSVRWVQAHGESCPVSLPQLWLQRVQCFTNGTGPTETTIYSHIAQCTASMTRMNVGKPIHNTLCYILDSQLQPVGIGVTGTLYISGCGISNGYHNNMDLTKQRFIINPYSKLCTSDYIPSNIMYNSGDLACWLPDGSIDLIGRADYQVKLRGHRIELPEIESSILQCNSSITHAAVVVRHDTDDINDDYLCAYIAPDSIDTNHIMSFLKQHKPIYMIPKYIVTMNSLPLSANGKLDRKLLPQPNNVTQSANDSLPLTHSMNKLEFDVYTLWKHVLNTTISIQPSMSFFDCGGHSLLLIKLVGLINRQFTFRSKLLHITITDLFINTTITLQAELLQQRIVEAEIKSPGLRESMSHSQLSKLKQHINNQCNQSHPYAIIGYDGIFPQCNDINELWSLLCNNQSGITAFTHDQLMDTVPHHILNNVNYVPSAGVLNNIEEFDNEFFEISRRDAEWMDPQQRLLIERTYNALQHANINMQHCNQSIGIFAAVSDSTYLQYNLNELVNNTQDSPAMQYQLKLNNMVGTTATRIAHTLNLHGPAITVNTACSSSLVAVQQAIDSIQLGRCDTAVVCAAAVQLPHIQGYIYENGMIKSPDGTCRPFDVNAHGTVLGNAVCAIVIRSLSSAQSNNDTIRSLICSVGINNSGNPSRLSFTASNTQGQADVITDALYRANITGDQIQYVEAHGTATELGDVVEVNALKQAFNTNKIQYCMIGSIKSNIGHCDTASGLVSIIKTSLILQNQYIPATLHYRQPNPALDIENSPFIVASTNQSINIDYAGVGCFGMGGTNTWSVMQKYINNHNKNNTTTSSICKYSIITLSAKTQYSLDKMIEQYSDLTYNVHDIAYTTQVCRAEYHYRYSTIVSNDQSMKDALCKGIKTTAAQIDRIVLMLPGQGSISRNVAASMYNTIPKFRQSMIQCNTISFQYNIDIISIMLDENQLAADQQWSDQLQLATYMINYSIVQLWHSILQPPFIYIGHSIGEYVAATYSGILSLHDSIQLIIARTRIMSSIMSTGAMLAARMSYGDAKQYINNDISLAAVNSTQQVVFSGSTQHINELINTLKQSNIVCKQLPVQSPFHSHLVQPLLQQFEQMYNSLNIISNKPSSPMLSTVTGKFIDERTILDSAHWMSHMRGSVLFEPAIQHLLSNDSKPGQTLFIECGHGNTLSMFMNTKNSMNNKIITTCKNNTDDVIYSIQLAIASVWCTGVDIKWGNVHSNMFHEGKIHYNKVQLPLYPYNKVRCWVDYNVRSDKPHVNGVLTAVVAPADNNQTNQSGSDITTTMPNDTYDCIQQSIISAYNDILGVQNWALSSNFFSSGGDSFSGILLLSTLNKQYNIQLHSKILLEHNTIQTLAQYIDTQLNTNSIHDNGLIELQHGTDNGSTVIYCIAPSGGTVFIYRDLVEHLDKQITVYGMKYPDDMNVTNSVEQLATYYVGILLHHQPDAGSYNLLGASFGGMIAWEIAQQLQPQNKSMNVLCMIDTPTYVSMRVTVHTRGHVLYLMFGDKHNMVLDECIQLQSDTEIIDCAIKYDIIKSNNILEWNELNKYMIIFQSNIDIMLQYNPLPYTGNILYIQCANRRTYDPYDPYIQWQQQCTGTFQLHHTTGDHLSMNFHPNVQEIATIINEELIQ